MEVTIPYNYIPRRYQVGTWVDFDRGMRRFVDVWHRRSGKDKTWWNLMIREAIQVIGVYYYFFPTYAQGKKVLWDGIDSMGNKFLAHVPESLLVKKPNETEMKLTLVNNSILQIVGTDNYNSIMGTNPRGCVFSEYALQDPLAWRYIAPILTENKGWAAFPYTPRGRNHGWELFETARQNPEDWHCKLLTVKDTKREDGLPVVSMEDIARARADGMGDELIEQEFFCSFEGFMQGAYYSKQLRQARHDGRLCAVPYDPRYEVYTFWDLGIDDSTTIWFVQHIGREYHVIDFYEGSGEGLIHYAKVLRERNYHYGDHYFPHDVEARELGTGKSRKEVAETLGIRPISVVKRPRDSQAVMDGIEQGRNLIALCWFDERRCARGLMALEGYRSEYDEDKKRMGNHPVHDWTSHGADAFRTFAVGYVGKIRGRSVTSYLNRQVNHVGMWG